MNADRVFVFVKNKFVTAVTPTQEQIVRMMQPLDYNPNVFAI